MTAATTSRTGIAHRTRTLLFAAVLAATSFAVQASPAEIAVEIPRPAELKPEPVLAYACADGPAFEGWLTNSTSSHPLITASTTGDVYGWISNVVDDWSCTAYYRYDGIVWARSATSGNFAWGNLINSTSVSCNWGIGSTDYLKANSTNDCPDSDAEYANLIHLGNTSGSNLLEGTFHADGSPDAMGDFAFIHSDCESYYGADTVKWNQAFGTGTGPRPGTSNCDPYTLDSTNTSQTITVGAAPTGTVSVNAGAAYASSSTVTLALAGSDASGVTQMRLSNTGNGSDWQTLTYATTASWSLAAGDGTRTVYAQFKDPAGNWGPSTPATDSVIVDATFTPPNMPSVTCRDSALNGTAVYQSEEGACRFRPQAASGILFAATAPSSESGIAHVRFENLTPSTNWTAALPAIDGTAPYTAGVSFTAATGSATIDVIARNGAGVDGAPLRLSLIADSAPPTTTISLPEANRTLSGKVVITGTAWDAAFDHYTLEYGAGATPTSWTTLGHPAGSVLNGTLATWWPGSLSGVYTLRLTASDMVGNTQQVTRTIYLENAQRGDEPYFTRVPFDLQGGWILDVGIANGEARVARDLFSIPSYGPAQELTLTYSSLETGSAGTFGAGWTSNLTQYLTFESGFVVWHRADGGRVPFGQVGGVWRPAPGHVESLTRSVSPAEDTITFVDQSKVVFDSASGRLLRIENRFGKRLTVGSSSSTITATDASGRATSLALDTATGQVTSAVDGAGRTWSFAYTSGNLTSVTDPAGHATVLLYGGHLLNGVRQQQTNASGVVELPTWSLTYDTAPSPRVAAVTDPIANATMSVPVATTFTYTGSTINVRVPRDYVVASATDATTYVLDSAGREVTATRGTIQQFKVWNPDSTLASQTGSIDFDDPSASSTFTYEDGRLRTEVQDDTTYVYTSYGDPERSTQTTDGIVVDDDFFEYVSGHLVRETRTIAGTVSPAVTEYAYTPNDQLAATRRPDGSVLTQAYDQHGNELAENENCTDSTASPPELPGATEWASCAGTGTSDGAYNVRRTFEFPAGAPWTLAGLPSAEVQPEGSRDVYAYDEAGRVLTDTTPGGAIVHHYDELGNEVQTEDPWNGDSAHSYDRVGRMTSETQADFGQTTTVYQANGDTKVVNVEDAYDHSVVRTFDADNHLTAMRNSDGTVDRFVYLADGYQKIRSCTDTAPGSVPLGNWWTCQGNGVHDATWNVESLQTVDPLASTMSNPPQAATEQYVVLIHGVAGLDSQTDDTDISLKAGDFAPVAAKLKEWVADENGTSHHYRNVRAIGFYGNERGITSATNTELYGQYTNGARVLIKSGGCWRWIYRNDKMANAGGPSGYKESRTIRENHYKFYPRTSPTCESTTAPKTMRHGVSTEIRHLSYHIAWWLYKRYRMSGISSVDVIGHSLGGILIRTAQENVAAQDSARDNPIAKWPTYLGLQDVVTIGSPHRGITDFATFTNRELAQLAESSKFMAYLNRYANAPMAGDWTLIGSDTDCVLGPICISPSSGMGAPVGGSLAVGDHTVLYRQYGTGNSTHDCSIRHGDYWSTTSPDSQCSAQGNIGGAVQPPTTGYENFMPVIWAWRRALFSYNY